MGYLVPVHALKYSTTVLFRRRCVTCSEFFYIDVSETKFGKCFVCETCTPVVPGDAVFVQGRGGLKIVKHENRVVVVYERQRKTRKNYANVFKRDQFICQYCFESGDTIDHINPVSCSGLNNVENLVCACRRCNLVVRNIVFESFYAKREYILNKIK